MIGTLLVICMIAAIGSVSAHLNTQIELYQKFDKKIDDLHREIINLNTQKDQILLSKDYDYPPKRVKVEGIIEEVNNLKYDIERITQKMQNLNVPAQSAP